MLWAMGMMAVLIPITRPRESTSGPPELPGFRGAVCWMTFSIRRPSRLRSARPRALRTPVETVESNPSGLPMAIASWPTESAPESPNAAEGRSPASARRTARSVAGSAPARRAGRAVPSAVRTSILPAPCTTWLLVMM